jgi:succinate-semialdehyde dehydrogenase / glutarate-semialdehyde dehydrogenase
MNDHDVHFHSTPLQANVLESQLDKLAELATIEMGKPIVEAEAEVKKCAWVLRHFADTSEPFLKPIPVETDAQSSHIVYQPLGVVFGIFPW